MTLITAIFSLPQLLFMANHEIQLLSGCLGAHKLSVPVPISFVFTQSGMSVHDSIV